MKKENLLERVLEANEERADYQKKLLKEYNLPVISLTLNLAGGYFQYKNVDLLWKEAVKSIDNKFIYFIIFKESRLGKWGPEGFWIVDLSIKKTKEISIEVEETHELGRLFDIDVINQDGSTISRGDFNIEPRKCMLCDRTALECYIEKSHTQKNLKSKVQEIIKKGLKQNG